MPKKARRTPKTDARAPDPMPTEWLCQSAECLKVLAHADRLRMVEFLESGPKPVHEVAEHCGLRPSQACEHLRLLQGRGLLASERKGRQVLYRIVAPQVTGLLRCIRSNCPR